MKIERDVAQEAVILADILALFPKREGVHMSDLNYCLRKAYWRKTEPDIPVDRDTILNWGDGLVHQWLVAGGINTGTEWELDGIKLSPDWIDKGYLVIEVKTTSAYPSTRAEPIEEERILRNTSWLRQMMAYTYAKNVHHVMVEQQYSFGLVVWHGMGYNKDIRFWKMTFTGQELIENWYWFRERWTILTEGLDNHKPPDVKYSEKWEHEKCPFLERCRGELEERRML